MSFRKIEGQINDLNNHLRIFNQIKTEFSIHWMETPSWSNLTVSVIFASNTDAAVLEGDFPPASYCC